MTSARTMTKNDPIQRQSRTVLLASSEMFAISAGSLAAAKDECRSPCTFEDMPAVCRAVHLMARQSFKSICCPPVVSSHYALGSALTWFVTVDLSARAGLTCERACYVAERTYAQRGILCKSRSSSRHRICDDIQNFRW